MTERKRDRQRNGKSGQSGISLRLCVIFGFLPAFLFSQKSEIFASFPRGEAFRIFKFHIRKLPGQIPEYRRHFL